MSSLDKIDCWIENNFDELYQNHALHEKFMHKSVLSRNIDTQLSYKKCQKEVFKKNLVDYVEELLTKKRIRKRMSLIKGVNDVREEDYRTQ